MCGFISGLCMYVLVTQSCLTLCNPIDWGPLGSSVHGILQARILEWIAIPFSMDLSDPEIEPRSLSLQIDSCFPGSTSAKEPACQCRRCKRCWFNPWVRNIPWRRTWQPTPVILLGKSYGQRSLAGYSPWGLKELDMTERLILTHS